MARKPRKKKALAAAASTAKLKDQNVRRTVILFADIIGASEVSNYKTQEEYYDFVSAFQKIFLDVCKQHFEAFYDSSANENYYLFDARGDEGILMIFPPNNESVFDLAGHVDTAITIAFGLKRRWLLSKENKNRVEKSGLLPIDIGIGIHLGRTWIQQKESSESSSKNPSNVSPEGYAINLAKRVEGESRNGRYTNVLLSESAHGAWQNLPDERTFIFDERKLLQPKGISRNIAVFEVKHHFLPTDWADQQAVSMRGKSLLNPEEVDLSLLREAHYMNPTNLWLAEEYVRQIVLKKYNDMPKSQRELKKYREDSFDDARTVLAYLANSDLRDAGILLVQGFVEGECYNFESEQDLYSIAIKLSPRLAEPYWYKALSLSYQLFGDLNFDAEVKVDDLDDDKRKMLNSIFDDFEAAKTRSANTAWIQYDYGCEKIRWAVGDAERTEGIEQIQLAARRLPTEVATAIEDEPYLDSVLDDPRISELREK